MYINYTYITLERDRRFKRTTISTLYTLVQTLVSIALRTPTNPAILNPL